MLHSQARGDQQMLRGNHVVIIVLREVRVHPVAGLGRFPVANAVGQNNKVAIGVQQLAGTKQLAGKLWPQELLA